MQLENFLCCMPLAWGVITTGLIWGIADFVVGTVGWHMVIEDEYSDWLVEFFRQMPVGYCVAGFSFVFYLMAIVHFMLAYGAYTVSLSTVAPASKPNEDRPALGQSPVRWRMVAGELYGVFDDTHLRTVEQLCRPPNW